MHDHVIIVSGGGCVICCKHQHAAIKEDTIKDMHTDNLTLIVRGKEIPTIFCPIITS